MTDSSVAEGHVKVRDGKKASELLLFFNYFFLIHSFIIPRETSFLFFFNLEACFDVFIFIFRSGKLGG